MREDATVIAIVPSGSMNEELWPNNGFVTIDKELIYYDEVEFNEEGRIHKLKKCQRSLEGNLEYHEKGTPVFGNVVAQHHDQLVKAIMQIQSTIGDLTDSLNFSSNERNLSFDGNYESLSMQASLASMAACPPISDDACPDVEFISNIISTGPTVIEFCVRIFGSYTSYRLDYGDGNFTTTEFSGTYTYGGGATVDPVVTVNSANCCIVQQPITTQESCIVPEPPNPVTPFICNIPEVPDFPSFITPQMVCPGPLMNFPPLIIPQVNCSTASSTASTISDICSVLVSIVGCEIPSQISCVGCNIPSQISCVGCNIPSFIEILGPSIISVESINLPSQISIVGCCPPSVISCVSCDIPSVISLIAGDIPSTISLVAIDIPSVINLVGDIPSIISVQCCDIPSIISVQCCSISPIEFADPPSFSPIGFTDVPSFAPIQFADVPSFTCINFCDVPSFAPICFCDPPSFSPIQFDDPPSFSPIEFGTPPSVTVDWGIPPTISCVCSVVVVCPSSTSCSSGTGFAARGFAPFEDNFDDSTLDGDIPITIDDIGIPSEIKVIAPKMNNIKLLHDIPDFIELRGSLPETINIVQSQPLPEEIRIVGDIPKSIALEAPASIKLDVSEFPSFITVKPSEDFPKTLKVEGIPEILKVEGIPSTLKVEGIPPTIEVVGFPKGIPLIMPENPTIELVYKGSPLEFKLDPSKELEELLISKK